MSQEYEGWSVQTRPLVVGLLAFLGGLVFLIVATGAFYMHHYAEQTRAVPMRFPSPTLETVDTAPSDTREIGPPRPPAEIDRATAATAAQGDALWNES